MLESFTSALMSSGYSDILSDDDDDLLLELSTRPPKPTQNSLATQIPNRDSLQLTSGANNELIRAQGEASMLRDKLDLLNEERKRDKERQIKQEEGLQASHNEELALLKLKLQNLEDEKKFLLLEVKKNSSSHKPRTAGQSSFMDPSSSADEITATENTPVGKKVNGDQQSKKRRIVDDSIPKRSAIATTRPTTDDSGQLSDCLMLHRIDGVDLRTMEILDCLKLVSSRDFTCDKLKIGAGESIGKQLTQLLLQCKKTMPLDRLIKTIIDVLCSLIQEIMVSKGSRLAIPFLLVIIYQTIIFRPSAVQQIVLKDLLNFICNLIKAFQNFLKRPLHEKSSTSDVEPQILQYELIDLLDIVYSYDILEASISVLQSHPSEVYREVLTPSLLKAIEVIYKLALPLSYKPTMSVVFNAVEILNMLSGMIDPSTSKPIQVDSLWWKDCINRLYHLLGKHTDTFNPFNENSTETFSFSRFHDVYGMVRSIGSNSIGRLIPRLLYKDRLQDLPRVILKDDVPETTKFLDNHNLAINMERCFLLLKANILNILENLVTLYPAEIGVANGTMLIQLTKFMSTEQELILHRGLGQLSPNLSFRCTLIEQSMALIYRLWMDHPGQMTTQHVKEIESELVTSLWRLVAATEHKFDPRDVLENQQLIDEFGALTIRNRSQYYDDVLENAPAYIEEELLHDIDDHTARIMQVRYDKIYQQMARTVLETKLDNVISIDAMDSLYVAMGK